MVDQHVDTPGEAAGRPVLGPGGPAAVELPPNPAPANEGRTVAAWSTVMIVVVGAVIAAVGVAVSLPALAWSGAGVVVIGLIVGRVLGSLGYGQRDARR